MTKKDNRLHWFSNTELRDYVNRIKTKHTLVTTEACFSGSIFTSGFKDITEFACNEIAKVPSLRAMTSGANTVVPDKSVFIKYLIKKLEENEQNCLSAETLYSKLKPAVIHNSFNNHIPQFVCCLIQLMKGAILFLEVGAKEADFIFNQYLCL